MENLISLDIRHGRISFVENGTFSQLNDLRHLILRDNNLKTISQCTFVGLISLRVLDLSENQISSITEESFRRLIQLKDLDLTWNHLTIVKRNTFYGLPKLETLHLSKNLIKHINRHAFNVLSSLKHISAFGNDIPCTCDNLRMYMIKDVSIMTDCSLPAANLENNTPSFHRKASLTADWNLWKPLHSCTDGMMDFDLYFRIGYCNACLSKRNGLATCTSKSPINCRLINIESRQKIAVKGNTSRGCPFSCEMRNHSDQVYHGDSNRTSVKYYAHDQSSDISHCEYSIKTVVKSVFKVRKKNYKMITR